MKPHDLAFNAALARQWAEACRFRGDHDTATLWERDAAAIEAYPATPWPAWAVYRSH